jgi:hypothetical protein
VQREQTVTSSADEENEQRIGIDGHSHAALCAVQMMTFELHRVNHIELEHPKEKFLHR